LGDEGVVETIEVVDNLLLGEFLALEAAFGYEFVTQFGAFDDAAELLGNLVGLVGGGIEGGFATGFGHGREVGGDDGGVGAEGFEDGDAETFEEGHIDGGDGTGVEGGEVVEVGIADEVDAVGEFAAAGFGSEFGGVAAAVASEDDEVDVGREGGKSLDNGELVFALFDGADADDIFLGQFVFFAHGGLVLFGDGLPEDGVAGLVDDVDFGFGDVDVVDEVLLGGLADGNDGVGNVAGVALLDAVGDAVEGFEVLWVMPCEEVVHGDDTLDGVGYAVGQFVAEAVEDVDFVALEMEGEAVSAPEVGEMAVEA